MNHLALRLGSAHLSCVVAETSNEHALGLQKHSSLGDGEGMFFLFERPRSPTFHMGDVRFPIDLMGVGSDSRINKIVEDARPGTSERWTFHRVSAVIEVPAGWSLRNGIKVGTLVEDVSDRVPAHEARREAQPRHAQLEIHQRMIREREEEKGGDQQYRDRLMPDDILNTSAFQDTPKEEYWKDLLGEELTDVALQPDVESPVMRRGYKTAQIVDEEKFVEKMSNIIFAHFDEVEWTPTPLNAGATERTVVNRSVLNRWLKSSEANDEGARYILTAAGTEQGLSLIGDAFILSGLADQANVGWGNQEPILVLYRENPRGFQVEGQTRVAVEVDITLPTGPDIEKAESFTQSWDNLRNVIRFMNTGLKSANTVLQFAKVLSGYLAERDETSLGLVLRDAIRAYEREKHTVERYGSEELQKGLISTSDLNRMHYDAIRYLAKNVEATVQALQAKMNKAQGQDLPNEPRSSRQVNIAGIPFEIDFRGSDKNIEVPRELFREAIEQIKRAGFGKALEGLRVLVSARYGMGDDEDILGAYTTKPDVSVARTQDTVFVDPSKPDVYGTLIHEIGHRYFFKLLPESYMNKWSKVMSGEVLSKKEVEAIAELLIESAYVTEGKTRKPYRINLESSVPLLEGELERFITETQREPLTKDENIRYGHILKRIFDVLAAKTGKTVWVNADEFAQDVEDTSFSTSHIEPISNYAASHPYEAFSEAFRLYIVKGPRALGPRTRAFFDELTRINRQAGFELEAGRKEDAWAFIEKNLETEDEDIIEKARKSFDELVSKDPSDSKLKYLAWMVKNVFASVERYDVETGDILREPIALAEWPGRINAVVTAAREWEKSLARIPPEKRNINAYTLEEAQQILVDIVQAGKLKTIREKSDTVISNVIREGGVPIWRSPDRRVLLLRIPTQAAAYESAQLQSPPFVKPAWCTGQLDSSYWRHYRKCRDSRFYLIIDRDTMQRYMLQESTIDGRIFWNEPDRSMASVDEPDAPSIYAHLDSIGNAVDADENAYPAWLSQEEDQEFEDNNYGECAEHDEDLGPEWYRIGDWEAYGFFLDDAEPWYDAGLMAEVARAWSAIDLEAEDAIQWIDEGFNPSTASIWIENDFTSEEAKEWVDAGFSRDSAVKASILKEADFTPETAYEAEQDDVFADSYFEIEQTKGYTRSDRAAFLRAIHSLYEPDWEKMFNTSQLEQQREYLINELKSYALGVDFRKAFTLIAQEASVLKLETVQAAIEEAEDQVKNLLIPEGVIKKEYATGDEALRYVQLALRNLPEDAGDDDFKPLFDGILDRVLQIQRRFKDTPERDLRQYQEAVFETDYRISMSLDKIEAYLEAEIPFDFAEIANYQGLRAVEDVKVAFSYAKSLMEKGLAKDSSSLFRAILTFISDLQRAKNLTVPEAIAWHAAGYTNTDDIIDYVEAGYTPENVQSFKDVFSGEKGAKADTVSTLIRELEKAALYGSRTPTLKALVDEIKFDERIRYQMYGITLRQRYKMLVEALSPFFTTSAVDALLRLVQSGYGLVGSIAPLLDLALMIREQTGSAIDEALIDALFPGFREKSSLTTDFSWEPSSKERYSIIARLIETCKQLGFDAVQIANTVNAWVLARQRPGVADVALRLGILSPEDKLFSAFKTEINRVVTSLQPEEAFNVLYKRLHGAGMLSEVRPALEGEPEDETEALITESEEGIFNVPRPYARITQEEDGRWYATMAYAGGSSSGAFTDTREEAIAWALQQAQSEGAPVYLAQEGGYRRIANLRDSVRFFGLK